MAEKKERTPKKVHGDWRRCVKALDDFVRIESKGMKVELLPEEDALRKPPSRPGVVDRAVKRTVDEVARELLDEVSEWSTALLQKFPTLAGTGTVESWASTVGAAVSYRQESQGAASLLENAKAQDADRITALGEALEQSTRQLDEAIRADPVFAKCLEV